MKIFSARPALAAATLLAALWSTAGFAHTGGHGGGGGHPGGGAHFAGGAHLAGGAHFSGATPSRFSATPHFNSVPSGRYTAPAAAARNFALARTAPGTRWVTASAGVHAVGAPALRGRHLGPGYGHPGAWGGGYWGGRFWPAAYYGPRFAWFLPTLPLYCATFWWNSVPYYYYDDAYYTWSPAADGYVATDPPPAAATPPPSADAAYPGGAYPGSANADNSNYYDGAAAPADSAAPMENSAPPDDPIPPGQFDAGRAAAGSSDHVFAYPTKGQSEQQQAQDRAACDQWAASQAGSGPGSPVNSANGSGDFRRAVIACFQGRGYSAQ